ncbi:MAG: hypothetical protein RL060_1000 [Bacteroidota bacterium]|jgi:hypothetical protein
MYSKYLYLTEVEWYMNWVNGGEVPIKLASRYKSNTRNGILTPDENQIHESKTDLNSLMPFIKFEENFDCKNINFKNITINGVNLPSIENAKLYKEDGLILSFCNTESEAIAKKFEKKVCVKILDINKLKESFDKQIGCEGIMENCQYTNSHERNHFLKSNLDEWQNEFRIFWKSNNEKYLKVPQDIAVLVKTYI